MRSGTGGAGARRHSRADDPRLLSDEHARTVAEARNALRQFDETLAIIRWYVEHQQPFQLRPSQIKTLHGLALDGLSPYAGRYRPADAEIEQSAHIPPKAHLVDELVEGMCDHVNDQWNQATAVHLAAYVMWRLNWIHPFADGNGRTSRCVSYIVLSLKLGEVLPGTETIPEQIARNRAPYFEALEAADAAFQEGRLDVSRMESVVHDCLLRQLLSTPTGS